MEIGPLQVLAHLNSLDIGLDLVDSEEVGKSKEEVLERFKFVMENIRVRFNCTFPCRAVILIQSEH
jgi:hypothetical protein